MIITDLLALLVFVLLIYFLIPESFTKRVLSRVIDLILVLIIVGSYYDVKPRNFGPAGMERSSPKPEQNQTLTYEYLIMAKETKKEVATKNEQLPSYIKQGQNRGNENVGNEDLQLPRIDVLQALSPQINKKKDEYIDGAEVGMLFNTLTGELYPDGVFITPVSFVKRFLVWVDRKEDQNGGLRGVFDTAEEAESFIQEQEDESKLELVPTAEHLVLLDDGTEVILSLAKSKMKVSRKFNSLVRLNGGDRFARRYYVTTIDDKGPKGEFQNISIAGAGFPSEEVYLKAEALYTAIASGAKKQAGASYAGATAEEGPSEY